MVTGHFKVFFLVLLTYQYGLGKQQQYNPNTDFLLHESGLNPAAPKRDYVASPTQAPKLTSAWTQSTQQTSGKRDYVSQFPALGPTSSQTINAQNPPSSGKRDYVAPQFPTLKPIQGNIQPTSTTKSSIIPAYNRNPQSPSGKRDYVAPQYTTLKPSNPLPATSGKVKDLVNFFDAKGNRDTPANVPSYSSILQGGSSKSGPTTTKPLSYGTVLAGSSLPSSMWTTITTPKTGVSVTTPQKPNTITSAQTSRPGTPVLPSSIVNNINNQASNSGAATDAELQTVSEELLKKDTNNAAKLITVNYQGKTTSQSNEDKASLPLLTVPQEVWNIPTIQKFVPLLDNYERDTSVNEYVTPQERNEENAFMDAIMSTAVIRHLMNFLKDKGYVSPDPRQQRDFLKQMWFGLYSRGKGKISSSGFEHVFVSELKNGEIKGLHNWLYFAKEEAINRVNYLGYMKYTSLSDKGLVMRLHMIHHGLNKPVNTLFIGTSPELELALYTLCYVTRADNECRLKLGGNDIDIKTYNFRYRSKNYIGSAYPDVGN